MHKLTKDEFLALSLLIKNNLDLETYCMLGVHAFNVDINVVDNEEIDNEKLAEDVSEETPTQTTTNVDAVLKSNSITRNGIDYIEINKAATLIRTNVPCMFRNNKELKDIAIKFCVGGAIQTFVPTNKFREVIIVDDFSELCTIEEICEKTGLTYFIVQNTIKRHNLPYLFSNRSRLYNLGVVRKLRDKYERWTLEHDGSGSGGCRSIHNL